MKLFIWHKRTAQENNYEFSTHKLEKRKKNASASEWNAIKYIRKPNGVCANAFDIVMKYESYFFKSCAKKAQVKK